MKVRRREAQSGHHWEMEPQGITSRLLPSLPAMAALIVVAATPSVARAVRAPLDRGLTGSPAFTQSIQLAGARSCGSVVVALEPVGEGGASKIRAWGITCGKARSVMRSCLVRGVPRGWRYSSRGYGEDQIAYLKSGGRTIASRLSGGGSCGRKELLGSTGFIRQTASRSCPVVNEAGLYRLHVSVSNTGCARALATYKRTRVPRWAVKLTYGVWGRRFVNQGWSCRYRRVGLAGTEHDLRCTRSARFLFTVERRQDGQ